MPRGASYEKKPQPWRGQGFLRCSTSRLAVVGGVGGSSSAGTIQSPEICSDDMTTATGTNHSRAPRAPKFTLPALGSAGTPRLRSAPWPPFVPLSVLAHSYYTLRYR